MPITNTTCLTCFNSLFSKILSGIIMTIIMILIAFSSKLNKRWNHEVTRSSDSFVEPYIYADTFHNTTLHWTKQFPRNGWLIYKRVYTHAFSTFILLPFLLHFFLIKKILLIITVPSLLAFLEFMSVLPFPLLLLVCSWRRASRRSWRKSLLRRLFSKR